MLRIWGLILGIGVVTAISAGDAPALGPVGPAGTAGAHNRSPVVRAHGSTSGPASSDRKKCLALNRCRAKYTHCYDKLVREQKNIEREKITCVKPYQKCINASFSGFDFFFDRWFNPSYLDCKKY